VKSDSLLFVAKIFFLFVLISVNSWLQSTIIEIKQDGTGDFETIQEGINASANSDTVLVNPGTYYENLLIENKSIVLASLYLTTENETYISNTILDGNHLDSVIRIENSGDMLVLGFIIQHGSGLDSMFGTYGGGVIIVDSICMIKKNVIRYNKSVFGGGIYLDGSIMNLIGNTIKYNNAKITGGGINMINNSNIIFSTDIKNNIYLNYAGKGSDFRKSVSCPSQEIIVDTFTVIDPDLYYLYASDNGGFHIPGEITYDIQNAKIEQVDADIYVHPDGDDENSGLSPEEPLQTIAYALAMVRSDTLDNNSVYLADGIYSPSINGQYFPLQPKNAVNISGESMENTILDVEYNTSGHFYGWCKENYYEIKNLKLINAYDLNSIFLSKCKEFLMENLYITNCQDIRFYDVIVISYSNFKAKNLNIINNSGNGAFQIWGSEYSQHITFENCLFKNNNQANHPDIFTGGGLYIVKNNYLDSLRVDIINTEISENNDYCVDWPNSCSALSISINGLNGINNVNLINSTIGNNYTTPSGGAVVLSEGVILNIYNSILYDDYPMELLLEGTYGTNTLSVTNSLVEGGEWGIGMLGNNNIIWDETNLDADPMWDVDGEFPYALTSSSPCIDTGTLDLPEGIELPEYDLVGNPRIVGETVDMGAYEFQGTNINEELIINNERINMSVYPNPFQPNNRDHRTSIKFNLLESSTVNLDIYNIKGQKVKSLMDAFASRGEYTCRWDGRDEYGKQVSSGQYICKLNVNDETRAVRKMVVIGR